jgi:MYXO-CTERM domain-containing protein
MKLHQLPLIAACLLGLGSAHANFSGNLDTALWSTSQTSGGNASAVVSGDLSSLTLTSADITDPGSALWGNASSLSYGLTFSTPELLSFSWSYTSADDNGSSADPFGYTVNGVFTQLSTDGSWDAQSGSVSLQLNAGDSFAFTINSTDSIFGAGTATLSNVSAVPEPASWMLSLAGLGALALRRRRARA